MGSSSSNSNRLAYFPRVRTENRARQQCGKDGNEEQAAGLAAYVGTEQCNFNAVFRGINGVYHGSY